MEPNKPLLQIEKMDLAIERFPKQPSALDIYRVLQEVFDIDINREEVHPLQKAMSDYQPLDILDTHLQQFDRKLTGQEIRKLINELFDINLEGIAKLNSQQISLYSKGQWIIQEENDLIVVHTNPGDYDVTIYPTAYYEKLTRSTALPMALQKDLRAIGFKCDEEKGSCYYETRTGEAVPDNFKHRTMGAIVCYIQTQMA